MQTSWFLNQAAEHTLNRKMSQLPYLVVIWSGRRMNWPLQGLCQTELCHVRTNTDVLLQDLLTTYKVKRLCSRSRCIVRI